MSLFGSLKSKLSSRKDSNLSSRTASFKSNNSANLQSSNPFTKTSSPTRRPEPPATTPFQDTAPPAYTPPSSTTLIPGLITHTADDPFAFLSTFDTIFLIDDSGSMAGRSWRETSTALRSIAPICTAHDADGIDLYFLNHADSPAHHNITTSASISHIFETVRPRGGTPTGTRLNHILKPYLAKVEREGDAVKPLNIIVITDGIPSDDVESVIINAARKLDKADVPAWQVGIQFFQVGEEKGAAAMLASLDDELGELSGGARDIVDTVPWNGVSGSGLNADGRVNGLNGDMILKTVLGSVVRRLDRKKTSAEWRR
ncbi:MAG: hypothetical protein M1830_004254 [Pleopsidium flavum]|nr:MAG: hypothetical protein M1830_004254 [Pleopsidium flavum]